MNWRFSQRWCAVKFVLWLEEIATFLGVCHSVISCPWKQFQWGYQLARVIPCCPKITIPSEDKYLALFAESNCKAATQTLQSNGYYNNWNVNICHCCELMAAHGKTICQNTKSLCPFKRQRLGGSVEVNVVSISMQIGKQQNWSM